MATISVTTFKPIFDNAQIAPRMLSAPVAVDMTAGTPVAYDTTTGKFVKADSTATDAKVYAGLLTKDTKAGYMGVAFCGLAYLEDLGTLGVGSVLTLSATAGALDDTQTGKAVARVVPLFKSGGSFEKVLEIFDRPVTV